MRTWIVLIVLSSLLWGCDAGPETAQDTFKQYLRHVYLNQDEEAWELVWPEDREQLVVLKEELEEAGTTHEIETHETLLVRAIVNPYAIKSVEMDAEQAADTNHATLSYELVDGRQGKAQMRRRGEQWYLKILP